MVESPTVVLDALSLPQAIAFFSFAAFTIGFFIWVARLWLKKH